MPPSPTQYGSPGDGRERGRLDSRLPSLSAQAHRAWQALAIGLFGKTSALLCLLGEAWDREGAVDCHGDGDSKARSGSLRSRYMGRDEGWERGGAVYMCVRVCACRVLEKRIFFVIFCLDKLNQMLWHLCPLNGPSRRRVILSASSCPTLLHSAITASTGKTTNGRVLPLTRRWPHLVQGGMSSFVMMDRKGAPMHGNRAPAPDTVMQCVDHFFRCSGHQSACTADKHKGDVPTGNCS